jgi:glutathione synthase/RimK-type ligase-like ATP-grasp enzyme
MPHLTIATCRHQDTFSEEWDDALLQTALSRSGVTTELVPWDDPAYDWSRPDLVLIRSTWDYPADPARFQDWASEISKQTALWNPVELVRWNLYKTYLLDLHTRGIPIIPTIWLPAHSPIHLASLMRSHGWSQVVIKPVVGTAGRGAMVVSFSNREAGEEHLAALLSQEAVMIQPFLPSFYSVGEQSLIFIDGILTHAMRKRFTLVEGLDQVGSRAIQIGEEERAFARRVLEHLPTPALVARVDLVRDQYHRLVLNELEVIGPALSLSQSSQALQHLVQACRGRLLQTAVSRRLTHRDEERAGLRFVPLARSAAPASS